MYAVASESITSTLFAASTSSALANAGSDKRVRVHSEEERPVDLLQFAVVADRLGDGEDVPLVERAVRSDEPR